MSVTFLASAVDGTNASSYTFSAVSFGTASADRYIIVGTSSTGTIASMTIGGVSATEVVEKLSTITAANNSIYIAAVPTGASGDIVVTCDVTNGRMGIGVWRATGLSSIIASDTGTAESTEVINPVSSTTIDVPAGGFAIGVSNLANLAASTGATWVGITEDYDANIEGNAYHSGAHDTFVSTQTGLTVSTTWATSVASASTIAVASWAISSTAIKTIDGLAKASVKTVDGLAIASVKTWNGLA